MLGQELDVLLEFPDRFLLLLDDLIRPRLRLLPTYSSPHFHAPTMVCFCELMTPPSLAITCSFSRTRLSLSMILSDCWLCSVFNAMIALLSWLI